MIAPSVLNPAAGVTVKPATAPDSDQELAYRVYTSINIQDKDQPMPAA